MNPRDIIIHGPIVNLNGEERASLIAKYARVSKAASELMDALADAMPHGRDYQTAPAGLCDKDRKIAGDAIVAVDNIRIGWRQVAERLTVEEGR